MSTSAEEDFGETIDMGCIDGGEVGIISAAFVSVFVSTLALDSVVVFATVEVYVGSSVFIILFGVDILKMFVSWRIISSEDVVSIELEIVIMNGACHTSVQVLVANIC